MTQTRRFYLFYFLALLFLTTLACQVSSVNPETAVGLNTDAIVQEVVATVQAQMPTPAAVSAPTAIDTVVSPPASLSFDLQDQLVAVYERVNPAVVHIFVYSSFDGREFPLGTGSGFVYNSDGHIVTNNHVVADGDAFEVVFADGYRSRAQLVGTDVDSDLAVIRAESLSPNAQPVPLGDMNALHVGQFVIAIGNPFGEAGSMSIGIVSGLGRTLDSQRTVEGGGRYSLPQVIQTDAAINPGNSGGPLLNLLGEVVGVNSAIRTDTGANSGVGFSIPVSAVKRIVPSLISNGAYVYPYLGIRMQTLDIDTAEQLNIPSTSGAYVIAVSENAPAAAAGLIASGLSNLGTPRPGGDLIIAINGAPIISSDDLISYLVFETAAGQTVDLTVVRGGKEIVVPLTLGERP
ncbi:MAG: trypsin-like peptidase domain-containing protein [Chloroflexi bacterium]|nr:trypsin-like peptidase domain-containing protein [Chloroflexota bacterium]